MIMSFEIFLINLVFSVEVEKMSLGQMSPRQILTGHMPLRQLSIFRNDPRKLLLNIGRNLVTNN